MERIAVEDPQATRSRTKQDTFNKTIQLKSQAYLRDRFLPEVQRLAGDFCTASIGDDGDVILIHYPASFSEQSLRPDILLEIGPLALWVPNAEYEIRPYAAEAIPEGFKQSVCRVKAVKAERTFWEKITILHHEAHRPVANPQPKGYARHYYDVMQMSKSAVKEVAFRNLELLRSVADFKDKFYPRKWARYDLATPGTLKLVPPDHVTRTLEKDYADMKLMVFGDTPSFGEMTTCIRDLEKEINLLKNPYS